MPRESLYFSSMSDEKTSWQTQVGNIIKGEFLGYPPLEGQGQTVLGIDSIGLREEEVGEMFASLYREFERKSEKGT